jgi:hypothetical protein
VSFITIHLEACSIFIAIIRSVMMWWWLGVTSPGMGPVCIGHLNFVGIKDRMGKPIPLG